MTYREERVVFTRMVGKLLKFIDEETPFEAALSYCKRCKDCPVGMKDGLHPLSLAVDIDLYMNGVYLSKTISHLIPGTYWESIGGSWGGSFNDGNHYSKAYGGRK